MKEKQKDLLLRALHTFWEGALAYLLVCAPKILCDAENGWDAVKPLLISAGIGALAAGFSALKTGILAPYAAKKKERRERNAEEKEERTDGETDEEKE